LEVGLSTSFCRYVRYEIWKDGDEQLDDFIDKRE
jgi:hypothetical protein